MPKDKDFTQTIAVVGLGPAGLAVAIEAARSSDEHTRTIAITNRETYNRNAVFRLNEAAFSYLQELIGTHQMQHYLKMGHLAHVPAQHDVYAAESHYIVQMKRLENILFDTLQLYEDSFELIYIEKDENVSVNIETSELSIGKKQRLSFNYIIACDGAHHRLANQLIDQGVHISYQLNQQRQLHSFHMIGCYEVSGELAMRKFRRMLRLSQSGDQDRLNYLLPLMKKMGWHHQSFPESRIFVVDNTLYIGTEAVKSPISTTVNQDAWLRIVLRGSLPDSDVEQLKLIEVINNSVLCGTFNIVLEQSNRIMLSLPNKIDHSSFFIQIGDALRTTHYHTGSGAIMCLLEAKTFGEYLRSDQTDDDRFQLEEEISSLLNQNHDRVEAYLSLRKKREEAARKHGEHFLFSSPKVLKKINSHQDNLTKKGSF